MYQLTNGETEVQRGVKKFAQGYSLENTKRIQTQIYLTLESYSNPWYIVWPFFKWQIETEVLSVLKSHCKGENLK